MKISDNELTMRGMNLLKNEFGPVDAERFVYVMTRDGFDYTEWQKNLFEGKRHEIYRLNNFKICSSVVLNTFTLL